MARLDVQVGENSGKRSPHRVGIGGVGRPTADPLDEEVDRCIGSLHQGESTSWTGRLSIWLELPGIPLSGLALPGAVSL